MSHFAQLYMKLSLCAHLAFKVLFQIYSSAVEILLVLSFSTLFALDAFAHVCFTV